MERNTEQLDFWIDATLGDLRLKDDRESMVLPLCSLGKRKRTAPIQWSQGNRFVTVTAPAQTGICTIWDIDVMVYLISQLKDLTGKANNLRGQLDQVQRAADSFQKELLASFRDKAKEVLKEEGTNG